ncbi:hypothetical protein SRB5_19610 [Streptomyces sp. RB5]|uniref:FxsA family protein n=1 Tax=Streptomyces smaragdinus TaxID=2585196 RepID=A0A7K0CFP3_9ACTN|nr:FxsA family membrane protein [Streptomyces smaragdinus]MQY11842.1 hypothetical protein [Streptomyces smaragdinus]
MTTPQPYGGESGPHQGPGAPSSPSGPGARRRRGRARYLPLVVAAWAVLEIWLLIQVGHWVGALGVFGLLVLGAIVGGAVVKRAGRRAWRGLAASLQPSAAPAEQTDGSGNAVTMLGGLLLMFPGFASDVLGLILLLPPVRSLVGRRMERALERPVASGGLGDLNSAFTQARIHRPDGKIVRGEVVRDDEPPRGS